MNILTNLEYTAIFNPKHLPTILNLLTRMISTNDNMLIKLAILEDEKNSSAKKTLESKITRQNIQLEQISKKLVFQLNRIRYENYYTMGEVEKHCGISWRNIERYSKQGYIERIKIGNEIKISAEQAQKALFILNCKKILSIPNKTAVGIYENEAERRYYGVKISQEMQSNF
jgi:hypothetical protein